jgi:hypothetical protein
MPAQARNAEPLAQALQSSEPLARLGQRLRESRERFECVRVLLPAELAGQVVPGPIDADGWTLLAGNPSVAAKLRQFVPELQSALEAGGHAARVLRIKVLPA